MDGKLHSLFSFLILVWILIFCPPVYSGNSLNQLNFTLNQIREKIKIIKNKENIEEPQKLRILYALYATEDNLEEIDMRVILMSKAEHKKIKELLPKTKIRFSKSCQCGFN